MLYQKITYLELFLSKQIILLYIYILTLINMNEVHIIFSGSHIQG